MNTSLPMGGQPGFEDLKRTNHHGAEYWSARDLQGLLGYSQWRRFADAVGRAMESCQASGNNPGYHFAGAGKPIPGGKVRDAIRRIGGTLPEDIAPAEHIRQVEKRVKAATPKLALDAKDAAGLIGDRGPKPESE